MAARALLQVNFRSISGEISEEDVDPGLESGVRGEHESLEASEYDSGSPGISAAPSVHVDPPLRLYPRPLTRYRSVVGIFSWLGRRFRRPPQPIDSQLWREVVDSSTLFADLDSDERERLKTHAEALLADKEIVASDGPVPDAEERVGLAALCALPVLELGCDWYRGWWTIVLFPDVYRRTWTEEDEFGVVSEYEDDVEGEVLEYGSVILSRRNLSGQNSTVVIHEMAHQLDRISGDIDGVPPLHRGMDARQWVDVFDRRLEELRRHADRGRRGALEEYAAESREEFFAVASERFFAAPVALERSLPDVYALLRTFYRQDTAARRRR